MLSKISPTTHSHCNGCIAAFRVHSVNCHVLPAAGGWFPRRTNSANLVTGTRFAGCRCGVPDRGKAGSATLRVRLKRLFGLIAPSSAALYCQAKSIPYALILCGGGRRLNRLGYGRASYPCRVHAEMRPWASASDTAILVTISQEIGWHNRSLLVVASGRPDEMTSTLRRQGLQRSATSSPRMLSGITRPSGW